MYRSWVLRNVFLWVGKIGKTKGKIHKCPSYNLTFNGNELRGNGKSILNSVISLLSQILYLVSFTTHLFDNPLLHPILQLIPRNSISFEQKGPLSSWFKTSYKLYIGHDRYIISSLSRYLSHSFSCKLAWTFPLLENLVESWSKTMSLLQTAVCRFDISIIFGWLWCLPWPLF